MWAWLTAIIRGIVEPLIASYQTYQRGRATQQRDDAIAAQRQLEELNDARGHVKHPVVNAEWLRHGNNQAPVDNGSPAPKP